jgi:acyl carrier protein
MTSQRWDGKFEEMLRSLAPMLGDEIHQDADLRDAGLDSMATVELLLRIEETYDIEVPNEFLTPQAFSSAAALWNMIVSIMNSTERADG